MSAYWIVVSITALLVISIVAYVIAYGLLRLITQKNTEYPVKMVTFKRTNLSKELSSKQIKSDSQG